MLLILIGTIPAALLRWVILRRPLSLWPAIGLSFLFLIGLTALWEAMGGKSQTPVAAATALSFTILWGRSARSRDDSSQPPAAPPPLPAYSSSPSLSSVETPPILPPAIPPIIQPEANAVSHQQQAASLEIEQRLAQLKTLVDKKLITESDYNLKKSEILNQI